MMNAFNVKAYKLTIKHLQTYPQRPNSQKVDVCIYHPQDIHYKPALYSNKKV